MIKAVVLDVDGVIVGETPGYNFPNPHPDVTNALKKIHEKGIPIILCTGKGGFSLETMVKDANLTGAHIADGGSIILDPIESKIIKTYPLPKEITEKILHACIQNNVYTEIYGAKEYYVQKSQESEVTRMHTKVLQKSPLFPESVFGITSKDEIIKLILIANNEEDKKRVEKAIEPFKDAVSLVWSLHPSVLPYQFYLVTAKGISKKSSVQEIIEKMFYVPFSSVLGVGDTMGDWNFMEMCEFVGVMDNAPDGLKNLARSKGSGKFYIGPSVEKNGILDIFSYFQLI